MAVFNMTGGGTSKPEQEKSVNITENGTVNILPDTGKTLSKVIANVNVQGGGGSGNADIHLYLPRICVGDVQMIVHSDCELAQVFDATKFILSNEFATLTSVDKLNMLATLQNITAGNVVSIESIRACYQFLNGAVVGQTIAAALDFTDLTQPQTTYPVTRDVLTRMTVLRNNVKVDSGTDAATFTQSFPPVGINASPINTMSINSDSYVTAGNLTIQINTRDAAMVYTYKEEGVCQDTYFLKVRWGGCSLYSGAYDQDWEIIYLGNGDVIIRIIRMGDTQGGAYTFNGITFTPDITTTLCCYRQDYWGLNWELRSEAYDIAHHNPEAIAMWRVRLFANISAESITGLWTYINNVSYDDNTYTVSLPADFSWHNQTSVVVSGNSWMGLGGAYENIRMHRRDAKMWYLYVAYWTLSDLNNVRAAQITWLGASHYNSAIDRTWSLWLFDNGDAMIHVVTVGSNTGSSDFFGQTYTAADDTYISFYYDTSTSAYDIKYEVYTLEHHIT